MSEGRWLFVVGGIITGLSSHTWWGLLIVSAAGSICAHLFIGLQIKVERLWMRSKMTESDWKEFVVIEREIFDDMDARANATRWTRPIVMVISVAMGAIVVAVVAVIVRGFKHLACT